MKKRRILKGAVIACSLAFAAIALPTQALAFWSSGIDCSVEHEGDGGTDEGKKALIANLYCDYKLNKTTLTQGGEALVAEGVAPAGNLWGRLYIMHHLKAAHRDLFNACNAHTHHYKERPAHLDEAVRIAEREGESRWSWWPDKSALQEPVDELTELNDAVCGVAEPITCPCTSDDYWDQTYIPLQSECTVLRPPDFNFTAYFHPDPLDFPFAHVAADKQFIQTTVRLIGLDEAPTGNDFQCHLQDGTGSSANISSPVYDSNDDAVAAWDTCHALIESICAE